MFGRISNHFFDLINRTKPPCDHQQSANSINDQLNDLSLQPENNIKVDTDKNGARNGENSEERKNEESLQGEKKESNKDMNLIQHEKGDENEGRVENEKEFEIVGEGEQERNKKTRSPVRPEGQDCSSFLQIGFFEFRINGKVNRPSNRQPQVGKVNGQVVSLDSAAQEGKEKDDSKRKLTASEVGKVNGPVESLDSATQDGKEKDDSEAEQTDCEVGTVNGQEESLDSSTQKGKEKDDSKAEQTDCESFDRPREGKSGKGCRFNHGRKTCPTVELNFMGLPIRPGEKDCPRYMRHGSCKYEANCRFNHPDPTSVGGSDNQLELGNEGPTVSPDASQSTPGAWSSAASNESPPYVPFMFPSTQAVPHHPEWHVPYHPEWHVPYHPEWHAYQAPVYPPERSMQLASGYAANSQPLERPVFTPQQQQIFANSQPLERPVFTPQQQQIFANSEPLERPVFTPQQQQIFANSQPLERLVFTTRQQQIFANSQLLERPVFTSQQQQIFANSQPLERPVFTPQQQQIVANSHPMERLVMTPQQQQIFANSQPLERPVFTPIQQQIFANSRPLERPVFPPQQQQLFVAEFPERPGQPKCSYFLKTGNCENRSACKFHHPKIECVKSTSSALSDKSTSSALSDSCLPLRPAVQPLIQEPVAPSSYDASFTKKSAGQNLVSKVHESTVKQPKGIPKKKSACQDMRFEVCNIACPSAQLYKEHLSGKKHTKNLQKLHASRVMSPALQASHSIKSCSDGDMGGPSGKGMAKVISPVSDSETKKQKSFSDGEMGTPSGKGTSGVTSLVTDLETQKQKSCFADKMGTPSGEGIAAVARVITDLKSKKQKSCKANKMGTPSGKGAAGVTSVVTHLETKELVEGSSAVQSPRACAIRNVACNGEIASPERVAGKKHLAEERALGNMANPNPTSGTNPKPKSNEKTTEKTNASGSAWCEVCKITCNSFTDLNHHKQGKKHKANVEKSQKPKTDPTTPAPLAAWQPLAQSEEPEDPEDLEAKKPKKPEPKDLEAKKQKVLELGVATGAVRACDVCNVICNTEIVFNSHLGGRKHAAMVKRKLKEAGKGS